MRSLLVIILIGLSFTSCQRDETSLIERKWTMVQDDQSLSIEWKLKNGYIYIERESQGIAYDTAQYVLLNEQITITQGNMTISFDYEVDKNNLSLYSPSLDLYFER